MTTDYRKREKRERAVGDNSCSINGLIEMPM